MSDLPVGARSFLTTTEPLRQDIITPTMIAAVGVCAILVIAGIGAALRGPWLDEFWTLELSDPSKGLSALIRDGWMHDAHPPVFNAWATLLASLGITSIPAGRLVSNLLAAGLMILAAFRLSRRTPGQAGFAASLLLLTLSLPQAVESFALYRSYFWQMTAIGTLVLVARHVALTKSDLDWRRDLDLVAIAVLATAASIGVHYVGALFGGLLASAIAVCAFMRGLRRWTVLVLATAALSSLFVFASVAAQAPSWAAEFDHVWIDLPGLAALGVLASLAVAPLWLNPVPLAGLWPGRGTETRDASQAWFLAMVGVVLVAGMVVVLAAHAFQPIVVDRYLFAVPVLVSALLAVPAARLARNRWLFGLLTLVAVVGAARPMIEGGIRPLWRENARTIATIVAGCPTTQVYAASGWALGPAAKSRMARREDPVFERAYRSLAEPWGYPVHFIGQLGVQNGSTHATPGACPVLLWYEHTPNEAEDDLPWAVEAAGLTGLERARLSVTRSATGFVLRADRPEGNEVSRLP